MSGFSEERFDYVLTVSDLLPLVLGTSTRMDIQIDKRLVGLLSDQAFALDYLFQQR